VFYKRSASAWRVVVRRPARVFGHFVAKKSLELPKVSERFAAKSVMGPQMRAASMRAGRSGRFVHEKG
jgi:hypothetical protein